MCKVIKVLVILFHSCCMVFWGFCTCQTPIKFDYKPEGSHPYSRSVFSGTLFAILFTARDFYLPLNLHLSGRAWSPEAKWVNRRKNMKMFLVLNVIIKQELVIPFVGKSPALQIGSAMSPRVQELPEHLPGLPGCWGGASGKRSSCHRQWVMRKNSNTTMSSKWL
jgi:hypothetical protein